MQAAKAGTSEQICDGPLNINLWEGDTLVVHTVGVREDVTMDISHVPHSPKMTISERFHETSPGILVNEMTIEDPEAFVTPWKRTFTYRYRPDLRIREFNCFENNRNVDPTTGIAKFK